jgi:hypothetical protein
LISGTVMRVVDQELWTDIIYRLRQPVQW